MLTPRALRSPIVRVAWIVAIILFVVGMGAWGTTCTGQRPRPTGDTIPAGDVATTPAEPTGSTIPG